MRNSCCFSNLVIVRKNENFFDKKIGKVQFFFKLTELNFPYGKCALANNRANEISSISFWPDDLPKKTQHWVID
jgi:hypothetical protein